MDKPKVGSIMWHDLTVKNAETVSDFYKEVVGWEKQGLSMGNYDDYVMLNPENKEAAAGVCHAQGPNINIPPQWLMYITVENLDASIEKCKQLGGKVLGEKRKMGEGGFYCLVQDPAGAYVMLCG